MKLVTPLSLSFPSSFSSFSSLLSLSLLPVLFFFFFLPVFFFFFFLTSFSYTSCLLFLLLPHFSLSLSTLPIFFFFFFLTSLSLSLSTLTIFFFFFFLTSLSLSLHFLSSFSSSSFPSSFSSSSSLLSLSLYTSCLLFQPEDSAASTNARLQFTRRSSVRIALPPPRPFESTHNEDAADIPMPVDAPPSRSFKPQISRHNSTRLPPTNQDSEDNSVDPFKVVHVGTRRLAVALAREEVATQ